MERTYARKHNDTEDSLTASFKQRLFAFIDRHADTFETLAHNVSPLSSSWQSAKRYGASSVAGSAAHQSTNLPEWMARSGTKSDKTSSAPRSSANPSPIGINRFRAQHSQS